MITKSTSLTIDNTRFEFSIVFHVLIIDFHSTTSFNAFNRPCTHPTNKVPNGEIMDLDETWVGSLTHGWGSPCPIFLPWGHPDGRDSPP